MYKCQVTRYAPRMAAPDPAPERRPRAARGEGGELRERLMEVATALIDELGGTAGLSIRAVTRRAGVSPMALYLHFADRDELVSEVVERGFSRFLAAVAAGRDREQEPEARLHAMGLAYLAFAREQPALYTVIFGRREEVGGVKVPSASAAFDALVHAVADCLPPAERDRAPLTALGLWTGLHGFVTLSTTRPGMEWPTDEQFTRELRTRWL